MTVFRIHVSLDEIEPPIWRRLELSSQTTLEQLHRILQIAMGWENYHLHEFVIDGRRYGMPDPDYDEPEIVADSTVCISDVLGAPGAEMSYLYDFGDGWQHTVRLEGVVQEEPGLAYPRVLDGARSCPPEDCGGPFGYADLLEALIDPTHENFEQMREWAGLKFNAEVLSIQKVNARLRRNRSLAAGK
jgi:hypothetical protein